MADSVALTAMSTAWNRKTHSGRTSLCETSSLMTARPLDTLSTFETAAASGQSTGSPARYAIRQALDQEYQKYLFRRSAEARQARYKAGGSLDVDENVNGNSKGSSTTTTDGKDGPNIAKRDFFGRIIQDTRASSKEVSGHETKVTTQPTERKVWVSFHEGFSK